MTASPNPRDLNPLQSAVNDAAATVNTLWLGFLALSGYLAVSTGSVTSKALVLQSPLRLPVLDIEIPVNGFFALAPIVLLIFHIYLMLQAVELAKKTRDYKNILAETCAGTEEQRLLRERPISSVFLKIFTETPGRYHDLTEALNRTIVLLTMGIMPLLILLQMQLTFLPYHSSITWIQRAIIAADLAATLYYWSEVQAIRGAPLSRIPIFPVVGISIVILVFSFLVAIYPGEWLYILRTPLTSALFEGPLNPRTQQLESPFTNRIVAVNVSFPEAVSLRGRDLRNALLAGSNLAQADFRGATLTAADFTETILQRAKFGCSTIKSSDCADLRGAVFLDAHLENSDFRKVDASGASFTGAVLDNADFQEALLIATDFRSAKLRWADIYAAKIQGASFDSADLTGVRGYSADDIEAVVFLDVTGIEISEIPTLSWTYQKDSTQEDSSERDEFTRQLEHIICENLEDWPYVFEGIKRNNLLGHMGKYKQRIGQEFDRGYQQSCGSAKNP